MARILRLSERQKKILVCATFFIAITILIHSEYTLPRNVAISLDEVYDPPSSDDVTSTSKNSSRILLVSALFLVSRSKVSREEHLAWLPRFLESITTDIYIYTTPDLVPTIHAARGPGLPIIVDTSFASPFNVPPLKGREAVYNAMHTHRGRNVDEPEISALRNAKPFFVEHAIRSSGEKKYDYVFWNDAGSFKENHIYNAWPNSARVERVWNDGSSLSGTPRKDLIFLPMADPPLKSAKDWTEDSGPLYTDFSQGSFFGGSPASMLWFSQKFYAYHDHFIKLGFFSGYDQTIYNALLLLYPHRFITVWKRDPGAAARGGLLPGFLSHGYLGSCGPDPYYYQWWLSDRDTREKMRKWWMARDQTVWKIKIPCRFTNVIGIESVLKRTFGDMWKAPITTVMKPTRTW